MRKAEKNLVWALACLLVCALLALFCGCSQQSEPQQVELPQPAEGMVQIQNNTGKTVTGLEYRTMEEEDYTVITLQDGSWLTGNWVQLEKLEEYQEQPFALRLTFEDGSTLEVTDLVLFGGDYFSMDGEGNVTTYLYEDQLASSQTQSTAETVSAA